MLLCLEIPGKLSFRYVFWTRAEFFTFSLIIFMLTQFKHLWSHMAVAHTYFWAELNGKEGVELQIYHFSDSQEFITKNYSELSAQNKIPP